MADLESPDIESVAASTREMIAKVESGDTDPEILSQLSKLKNKISKLEIKSEEDGKNLCIITKKKISVGSGFLMALVAAIVIILSAVVV